MTTAMGTFGFDTRPMTWREHLRVDLSVLRDDPRHALSGIVLWAIIGRAMLGWLALPDGTSLTSSENRHVRVAVLIAAIPMALILSVIGGFYATIIPSSGSIIWTQAAAGFLLTAVLWARSRKISHALALAIALPLIWLGGGHQAAADPAHLSQR